MKLTICVGVLNQFELAEVAIRGMVEQLNNASEVELMIIDNGSDVPFAPFKVDDHLVKKLGALNIIRNEENTGNYPMFKQALEVAKGEYIAFIHSDVFVYQKGWDSDVLAQFEAHADLGLIGFIGSTEMDNWSGRGMGTVSNMQGRTVEGMGKTWTGSAAHHHGKVSGGMTIDGSVVDGCVMIFKKSVLETIGFKGYMPPHHFYDRLMSAQVIEAGFKVGILGVAFDHISGQVANTQGKWQDRSKAWFFEMFGMESPNEWGGLRAEWVHNVNNPSRGKIPEQWDHAAYLEAEYQFLKEYRDEKHLVPMIYGKRQM